MGEYQIIHCMEKNRGYDRTPEQRLQTFKKHVSQRNLDDGNKKEGTPNVLGNPSFKLVWGIGDRILQRA